MPTESTRTVPPKNGVYKNGEEKRRRNSFTPWFWSGRGPAKAEAVIVILVFGAVIAIMAYLFQMPGPLVVHVQDDQKEPIKGARVRCTSPDGSTTFNGLSDVFGEAKWPGLAKGPWKCEVMPPDRFHAQVETGYATVVPRRPAMWITTVERPARITAQVVRPQGAPRAAMAVRAVCGDDAWEARTGLLDGLATLYVPHGKACRLGLARPELPGDGRPTSRELDCDAQPCAGPLRAGVGESINVTLKPTVEQWASARPPIEPEQKP